MRVLVTGGAGFIGSHVCVSLAERGHDAVIMDNFSNSDPAVVERLRGIAGVVPVVRADVRDVNDVRAALRRFRISAVVHCAGLKSVAESWERSIDYFDNNVGGTIAVLAAMRAESVRPMVFSSSATVYGAPDECPVTESAPLRCLNPYGRSKLVAEDLIRDACAANPELNAGILRYFNPVGAHPSGLIGESPTGVPNNLMPVVCQVADGMRDELLVFGGDYPTRDGTGVRDFIHVVDLASAHVAAIEYLTKHRQDLTLNIGTGNGHSVLELVQAMERVSGRSVPYRIVERREGDAAEVWADASAAREVLNWAPRFDLDAMCRDAWQWQIGSPVSAQKVESATEMAVVA